MEKNSTNFLSNLDSANVLRDSHNASEHAIDVVLTNDFVPKRYIKVSYDYKDMGDGTKEVEYITWIGEGVKEKTIVTCRGNADGKSEITTFSFSGKTPAMLGGRYFTIYDDIGSVGVRFNLDGASVLPNTGALRDIDIDIATGDSTTSMALKFKNTIDSDSQFSAMSTSFLVIVSSNSVGNKPSASDGNTGLGISVTDGLDSINNTWFPLYSANDEYKFHVWYNLDGGGVDPDPDPGVSYPIEVQVTGSDDDKGIATKSAAAINAIMIADYNHFVATNDNGADHHLVITNFKYGPSTNTVDFNTEHIKFRTAEEGILGGIVGKVRIYYDETTKLRSSIEKII